MIMKKTGILFIALLFSTLLVFQSCNKYEDGPSISLRSAKARICNTWVIDKAYIADIDVTTAYMASFKNMEMSINKDGSYTKSFSDQSNTPFSISGTWEFGENNTTLIIKVSNITISTLKILRLASKELWLSESYNDANLNAINYEVHYKTK
jgi:hypothetical protein